MNKKYFALRVDIDSLACLTDGVPNILRILRKHNIKASFFLTLGREGNFIEVLKYKSFGKPTPFPHSRLKTLFERKQEIFKALFLPIKLESLTNALHSIQDEGHHVGLHSYIHVKWRHPDQNDLTEEFSQMITSFRRVFGRNPDSFASPYFFWNNLLSSFLDQTLIKYSSCQNGIYPFINGKKRRIEIPVNTKMTNRNYPLVEYFARLGYSDERILRESTNVISKHARQYGLVTTYIHPRIEGHQLLKIFEGLVDWLRKNDYVFKTYEEIGDIYCR